jgi:hypothetical protein
MTNDLAQLSDILVDWTRHDIDNLLRNCKPETDTTNAAAEFIRCMLWTMSEEPEALRIFNRLLKEQMKEQFADRGY